MASRPRTPFQALCARRGLLAGVTLLLAACGSEPPRPNLLLVTLDTTRADRLGAYGYAAARTPVFDALARRGLLFERAYAPAPITLPSHGSMLTGVLPTAHGVHDNTLSRMAPEAELVSEVLLQQGWRTGAFVGAFVLAPKFGLDQGFEIYDAPSPAAGAGLERPAEQVVDAALQWLGAVPADGPFFAWVHFFDAHGPHEPPEPYRSQLADPYDGELAYADAQLGRLLNEIERLRPGAPTAVIVVADHGEALGDHGEESHGVFLYDETLRVPLVVVPPHSTTAAARRVSEPVSNTAVAPLLLELAGLGADLRPAAWDGQHLRSLLSADAPTNGRPADPIYLETRLPYDYHRWHPLTGIVWQGYKLVSSPRPELYDLTDDPGELRDLATADPQRAAELQRRLDQLIADHPPLGWDVGDALDSVDRERLVALGYVGTAGGDGALDGSLPLPRDRIGDLQLKHRAVDCIRESAELLASASPGAAGDSQRARSTALLAEARALYATILEQHADDPGALGGLVTIERTLGDDTAALAAAERHARLVPRDPRVLYSLAELRRSAGRDAEALAAMEQAAALVPQYPVAFQWLAAWHAGRGAYGHAAGWLAALDAVWWETGKRRDDLKSQLADMRQRMAAAGQVEVAAGG